MATDPEETGTSLSIVLSYWLKTAIRARIHAFSGINPFGWISPDENSHWARFLGQAAVNMPLNLIRINAKEE